MWITQQIFQTTQLIPQSLSGYEWTKAKVQRGASCSALWCWRLNPMVCRRAVSCEHGRWTYHPYPIHSIKILPGSLWSALNSFIQTHLGNYLWKSIYNAALPLGIAVPGLSLPAGPMLTVSMPVVPALISGRMTAALRAALRVHLCRLSPVPSVLTQGTTSSILLTARLPAQQGMQALRARLHSSTSAGTSHSFSGCHSVSLQTL